MTCTDNRLTSTYLATCETEGWSVRGCCVPATFTGLYTPQNFTSYKLAVGVTPIYPIIDPCCQDGGKAEVNPQSIGNQLGWTMADEWNKSQAAVTQGLWDESLVTIGSELVWRLSNYRTTTGYSSQPFSYTSCEVAGETGSSLWNDRGPNSGSPVSPPYPRANATSKHFYWGVDVRSATGSGQAGLRVALTTAAKQSNWRMGVVYLEDTGTGGLSLATSWATHFNVTSMKATFNNAVTIASGLSYTDTHRIETYITFVDGMTTSGDLLLPNDILEVYLNGNLIHTSTTWEAYYREAPAGGPGQYRQAVNALMFRVASTPKVASPGGGFYFSKVFVSNAPPG